MDRVGPCRGRQAGISPVEPPVLFPTMGRLAELLTGLGREVNHLMVALLLVDLAGLLMADLVALPQEVLEGMVVAIGRADGRKRPRGGYPLLLGLLEVRLSSVTGSGSSPSGASSQRLQLRRRDRQWPLASAERRADW